MDLKRFFYEEKITDKLVTVTGNEFYHAIKVTRHKVGYKLILCDNGNNDYYAQITEIGNDYFKAEIYESIPNESELPFSLTLYIGNNKELDTVAQKAVEMGVTRIVPFFSQHCNCPTVSIERLNRLILESSKQTGRSSLCKIDNIFSFDEMLLDAKKQKTFAFYEYEKEKTVHDIICKDIEEIGIIIGPEGGFSVEEIEKLHKNDITTYSLGKRILRVSTACVVAMAIVSEHCGV